MLKNIVMKFKRFRDSRNWRQDWRLILSTYCTKSKVALNALFSIPVPYEDYIPEDMVKRTQNTMTVYNENRRVDPPGYTSKVEEIKNILREDSQRKDY